MNTFLLRSANDKIALVIQLLVFYESHNKERSLAGS